GGAALELELEERLGAAAVDYLHPGVGGWRDELDDFDDTVGFAAVALEVDAVAVALALLGGRRDGGGAVREPLGHAAHVGEDLEHLFDGDPDQAGVRQRDGAHGCNLQPERQRWLDFQGLQVRGRRFYVHPPRGAVAQLGERLDRTQEVRGSSPLSSTVHCSLLPGRHWERGERCAVALGGGQPTGEAG